MGAILAPTVILGGQVGSLINSNLSEETAIRIMIVAYVLVGLFVLGRILVLGGGAAHQAGKLLDSERRLGGEAIDFGPSRREA